MSTSTYCRCGRVLDWSFLRGVIISYNASITCEACGATFPLHDGKVIENSGQGSLKSIKGKAKETKDTGNESEKYSYARLQLMRWKNRYVYNPFQGSELEAPKYSGMLLVLGKEWFVPHDRRYTCSVCGVRFDFVHWKYNCRACGEVVCNSCSPNMVKIPGYDEPQKVCFYCHSQLPALPEWRERFCAIQSSVLYLRTRAVLEDRAKGCIPLLEMDKCERISDVSLKAETGFLPPANYTEYCFKITFVAPKQMDTANYSGRYFCAKNQEVMNSWIVALNESSREIKSKQSEARALVKLNEELFKACKKSNGPKVKDLLKKHADPTFVADRSYGTTTLMHCATSNKSDSTLCATLILQSGTNPNVQDWDGKTALHLSLGNGRGEDTVMDVLLKYGSDLAIEEATGLTAFEWANIRKFPFACEKIVKYERDIVLTETWLQKMLEKGGNVNWRNSQGNSLLHYACLQKQPAPLKFLLENRANINIINLYGLSALHVACISHFEEGIRILLSHKADIDIRDNLGYTPLHIAVIFNAVQCVEVLLNHGANPNIRSFPTSGAVSPLHLSACLGFKECAEKLLIRGSNPNMEDDSGQTAITISKRFDTPLLSLLRQYTDLHKLFQFCKDPAKRPDIEQLLQADKTLSDRINWPNGERMTMLHVATISQNLPVVELLLGNGADFDLADNYGNTPIDIANGTEKTPVNPSAKNEKIYQRYLQFRRINALNGFIKSGSLPDVKRLLKDTPTEYNLHVEDGMAPLHIAAREGYVAICKRLMKGGARIDYLTLDGKTPIHLAAERGKVDCLRMLLSDPSGKSLVNLGDVHGDTALILCAKNSPDTLEGTCEVLLSFGAEVDQKNRDGKKATDISTSTGFKKVLKRHKVGIDIIEAARRGDSQTIGQLFKENKEVASADFKDIYGKTALHYACASQAGESCVSILLGNGARVELRDNEEKTPLDVIKSRDHTQRTQKLLTQYAAGIQVSSCALSGQKQRMQQLLTKFDIDVDFCDQIEMKTPLHWACIAGSRTCVDYLLSKNATVDVKDKNSETPLFLAVRNGHRDIIEILLEKGANPEISDACGVKLVDSICDRSRFDDQLAQGLALFTVMSLLNITIGAHDKESVEKNLNDLFERLEYEETTLRPEIADILVKHISGRKFVEEYAAKGDLAHMKEMYSDSPEIIGYKSAGETALHVAVRKGYVDVVEDLLEQGASISVQNGSKKTPLDIATEQLQKNENSVTTKIMELLNNYGCGPEIIDCCYEGNAKRLESILAKNIPLGFNVDYKFKKDFTALHVAARYGHLECLEVLQKHKADPDKQDADGFTPLHYAARWGREAEVTRLLELGADVEQRNDQGLTPIMMAALGEHSKCLQILTNFGAKINIQNNFRQTPLMLAVLSGFTDCVQLLLEKGADPNLIDKSKNTALHYATIQGHTDIIRLLLASSKIDPNLENRMAHTPAIIATAKGNATLLKILLEQKATDPNFGSKITALFVAINDLNVDCVKLLLENNADPNPKQGVEGLSPLHRAVILGDVPIIETLLSYNADPLAPANFKLGDTRLKLTPLDLVELSHMAGLSSVPTRLLRCKAGATEIRDAISKGEITALKSLLVDYSDADVVNYQDTNGRTPLHWACEKEYVSCVKAVLIYYPNTALKDKEGNLAMALAEKNKNPEVKKELQSYENCVQLLKEATAGRQEEIQKLLETGEVNIEFTKPDKNTVVHLTAAYGYVNCLTLLLNSGAGHLASRPNNDKQLPIHLAAIRGHANCVKELINVTKPGGKILHDELWTIAITKEHRELIMWLHSDLCSHKELPKNLFPSNVEIEYHFGELVHFLSVPEDVTLYELEQQIYAKQKRYIILEQRLTQGRTQIRDDQDLKKAIATAKKETPKTATKVTVQFHCVQNLENKPLASAPNTTDNPVLKPITTKLTTTVLESTATVKPVSLALNEEEFKKLRDGIAEKFLPYQKELEKELKKLNMHAKVISQQGSDIYTEIQSIKEKDREFVSI